MSLNNESTKTFARRSRRMRGYDYSRAGAYYVTICTHKQECIFGSIANCKVKLSFFGRIVQEEWLRTAELRPEITLDDYLVMPNHLHGIIIKRQAMEAQGVDSRGARPCAPTLRRAPKSLGSLVAGFKSSVTSRINAIRNIPGAPVWQLNYYDHIIRDREDLHRIRGYIRDNPFFWDL